MATKTDLESRITEAKKQLDPGVVALFRMGDFYEAFGDDAKLLAKVLGLTLTTRGRKGENDSLAMAGFPYHQLESYLQKLIANKHRVAICEPAEASNG